MEDDSETAVRARVMRRRLASMMRTDPADSSVGDELDALARAVDEALSARQRSC